MKPTGRTVKRSCALLREHGIAPSYHRTRILECLQGRKDHPTADAVYRSLSTEIATLSRTTVYNTLRLLVRNRLALALTIEDTETRFDGDVSPHAHFKCTACGRVLDIAYACGLRPGQTLADHRIASVDLYLKGTCATCLARQP